MAIKFLNTATGITEAAGDNSTKIATTAYADAAAAAVPIGSYLPLAGGTMTGQIIMGDAGGSYSHELKFANDTYIAGIDFQNSGELRFIDRSGGRESITFNLLNGSIEARNTGNTVTNFISTSGNSYFNGGFVGIGTTSPAKKLHILNDTDTAQIRLGQTGSGSYDIGVRTGDKFSIGRDNDTQEFTISGGNVGIGTNSPSAKLEVLGVDNETILTLTRGNASHYLTFRGYQMASNGNHMLVSADDTKQVWLGHQSTTKELVIDVGGNVGIGTDSPSAKLSISDALGISGTGNDTYGQVDLVNTQTGASGDEIGPFITFRGQRGGVDADVAAYGAIGGVNTGTTGNSTGAITFLTKNAIGAAEDLVEQMRISTGGNVGIGTTSPGNKLHVENTVGSTWTTRFSNTIANSNNIYFGYNNGTTSYGMYIDNGQGAAGYDISTASGFTVRGDGNVGIGTTNPVAKLDVVSTANGFEGVIQAKSTYTSSSYFSAFRSAPSDGSTTANGGLWMGSISNDNATISSGAIYRSAGQWRPADGTASIINMSSGSIGFSTNSGLTGNVDYVPSPRMIIASSGNVGIGTTTPFEKIDVDGNIYAQNRIISADVSLSNKNLLPEASIKFASQNDIYSNSTKTTISPYEARWVNTSGSTTIRASTATLVNGEVYTVSIYYKDLIGSLTMDLGDTALTGSYKSATGTAAIPTSGRIYGRCIRNSNNYEFIDVNLSTLGEVTLLNIKLEQGNVVTEFIATPSTQAVPQTITTNNIITTGSVGIGTTSPQSTRKLDVAGHIQGSQNLYLGVAGTNLSTNSIEIGAGRTGNGFAYMDLTGDATYTDYGLRIIRNNTGANASSQIVHRGTGDFSITTTESADILLIPNSGNVGIGTTSPYGKLDVAGNIRLQSDNRIYFGGTGSIPYWTAGVDNTTNNNFVIGGQSYYSGDRDILLTPVNNGNVGIGDANPSSKLSVNGGIQVANDSATASAANVGTIRYQVAELNSYVDMCMQTGATTYAWVNIVQNNW